jgi:hypothetical protein
MVKEYVEVEVQVNGKTVFLDNLLEVTNPPKGRAFVHADLGSLNIAGKMELYVREVKPSQVKARKAWKTRKNKNEEQT